MIKINKNFNRYLIRVYLYKKNGKPGFNTRITIQYNTTVKQARREVIKHFGTGNVYKVVARHKELV